LKEYSKFLAFLDMRIQTLAHQFSEGELEIIRSLEAKQENLDIHFLMMQCSWPLQEKISLHLMHKSLCTVKKPSTVSNKY